MDWLLSGLVLLGNFLVTRKNKWGLVVLSLNSLMWIYYAFTLNPVQYGLVPSAVINFVVISIGVIKWFKEDKNELGKTSN
jgi:hypothetical protein